MTNQQLLQQLQQLLEAAQNLGAPAAQIVQQIRLLINRVQVLNANDPANQNDVNEFNRLQGEFQRLQQPAPQPQQPPPGQQPPGLYLPPIPVNVQGGINVQIGKTEGPPPPPPHPQPVPWYGTLSIVLGSLLTLIFLTLIIVSKIPSTRKAKAVLTKESAQIQISGTFDDVDDATIMSNLFTKIETAQKEREYEVIKKKVDELREEIAKIKATPPLPPQIILKTQIIEKPVQASSLPTPKLSAAPSSPPEPIPTADEEYSFTWLNSRWEPCEIWIDGVLPRKTLKPGESVHIRANTPLTAWARGVKTQQIWKCKITKEKIEKSKEKILEIY